MAARHPVRHHCPGSGDLRCRGRERAVRDHGNAFDPAMMVSHEAQVRRQRSEIFPARERPCLERQAVEFAVLLDVRIDDAGKGGDPQRQLMGREMPSTMGQFSRGNSQAFLRNGSFMLVCDGSFIAGLPASIRSG